ncbi:MAG: ATP-binding protein [Rhodobacteraceae bacterium]|nr:ATP-binding protein [Paracoccaceae bacterium]
MLFRWLKRYVPRGLYGRAALILILPVVTLQLVVSVVFIQRHFEGVTQQMTREVAREIRVILRDQPDLGAALSFKIAELPQSVAPEADIRPWFDFTGIVVIRTLREMLPLARSIDLSDDRQVVVFLSEDTSVRRVQFDRRRVSASNPHQLLVNMVFFGALMTVIAFIYMRNQLRPITRLARAAEAFGRGRSVPYTPGGAVEVRAAGSAFLDMRARIERHIDQRTMMLSGVSHDLRTPLTRLRLEIEMLDDTQRAPMERDVADMQRLIDAFLDFARGDAAGGDPVATDPIALVQEVVQDARRGGGDVSCVLREGHGEVMLKPDAIRRAVQNLIGNAVRYGTKCEVSVLLSPKTLRISVEDDGPGIAKENREDAVRPFVRLDPARNQDKGPGVGLGLAIAADIARAHGGMLRLAESQRLGGLKADIVMAR